MEKGCEITDHAFLGLHIVYDKGKQKHRQNFGGAKMRDIQWNRKTSFQCTSATSARMVSCCASGGAACVVLPSSGRTELFQNRRCYWRWHRKVEAAVVVMLFVLLRGSDAYNVDTDTALVHVGPDGSMFGFSVAQHIDQSTSW